MKQLVISVGLALASSSLWAQEVGQVISRTPVFQQVATPRQVCTPVAVTSAAPTSGAGALMGAIAGGAIGQQIGGGTGQALATMAGVVGGALLGDRIESPAAGNTTLQQQCTVQTVYENRLTGYNVVYEYAGKQYNVQLPQDPGPTIALQISPVAAPASPTPVAPMAPVAAPAPVIIQPPVVVAPPVYVRPWPPISTSINLGWGWYGGGHHRHWR